MKKLILFIVLIMTFNIYGQETITNESIIQMQELGFEDSVIIDKINTSDVKFDSSIAGLSSLKTAGVSSDVISLVMQKSKHNSKSKTGIYYYASSGDKKLIQPSVFSGTNSNAAAQKLVSGLINSKKKAQLPKKQSNNVVSGNAEFLFVFDPSASDVDNMQNTQGNQPGFFNWWFRMASNPNEFVLVKLRVKERKNLREVVIGKESWISSSQGIDPRYALPYAIEEVEGNKFKVIPETLEPGEYCFIYQGQVPQGRDNQAVFDFSVQ